jgi:hypothetical protein
MGNSVSKHSLKAVNSRTAASHNLLLCQFDEVWNLRQRFHVSKLAFGAGIDALQLTICEPCFGTRATFQEDEDMADQNEAKTKTIGFLPIEKVQTLRGWEEYVDKSTKLSALRTEAQKAKNSVRDALKERLGESGDMDFAVEGDRIRVFRVFRKQQQGRRTRALDLSSSFREQRLEREAKGQCDDREVCDETEDVTPHLNPITEEAAASLDPVTERLMVLMREKGQR